MKKAFNLLSFITQLNIDDICDTPSNESIAWYNSLPLHTKINLKDISNLIVGVSWDALSSIFNYKEKIHILHTKLKLEGFKI